ncbi:hypothetical protein [Ruegeria sp.]|uniref:hypothetical protein n=1 Tax=Ruegeria sp. TaxID=1879320 RepID=UPI003B58E422
MATAYFLTAAIVCVWAYTQARAAARNIRIARDSLPCPLDISNKAGSPSGK